MVKVQADKQAAPVLFRRSPTDTPDTEREWEDALHVLSKPKSGRAFGPDAVSSELIAAGGQGYRRALGVLCAKVSKEGAPMLWKGGDMTDTPRKPEEFLRACSRGALAPVVCWNVADGSCPGRRCRICHQDAQPFQFLGSVEKAFFRRHLCGHSEGLLLRSC